MLLRRYNLNLLPILRELLRTKSVRQTAESVGLGQPAVSAALARLREMFQDDLLVMVGRKLELTERAEQLIDQTERAYVEAEVLLKPRTFDPKAETRRFIIATADYVTVLLAPRLAGLLAEQAPNASVQFIDLAINVEAKLMRGAIDVAIMPDHTVEALSADAASMPLFEDKSVIIASRRNPPFKGKLTRKVYEQARHAMFQVSARSDVTYQSLVLRTNKITQHNVVLVQQFLALPAIVEQSDCLSLVQRRLAELFQRNYEIDLYPTPFEAPPLSIRAYWSRTVERDPAHVWFRKLLASANPVGKSIR